MSHLAIQSVLAVNEDAEILINLLITVIMIAICLAGSMIRTKGNKGDKAKSSSRKRKRNSSSPGDRRDGRITSKAINSQTKIRRENLPLKVASDGSLYRKEISDVKEGGQLNRPQNKTDVNRGTQVKTEEGLTSSLIDRTLESEEVAVTATFEEQDQESILDVVPSQWDSDDLAQAILYQEILGSPVGMRNSNR